VPSRLDAPQVVWVLEDNHYEGIARPRPAPVTLPERPRTYDKRLKRKAAETSDRDDERPRKRTATAARLTQNVPDE
jgi:hypothetical protein